MTVLEDILSHQIVQKLGWTLLHFIWQAAVVALLLAILLRVLRKSTANLRYIIACLALALIVLLPVITIQLVPVSAPQSEQKTEFRRQRTEGGLQMVDLQSSALRSQSSFLEEPEQPESVALVSADSWKQRTVGVLEPALPYIVSGWLVGVFALSVWHLGGWAQLQRLRRRMVKQVDDKLHSKLKVLAERLRVKQTVQLMESALVQIPTVVGWLRPVILLPASALTGLSAEQLEAILAHELAHIKRFDYLVNMLQTVVEILGFYHPAVWWVSHKIRAERENCCDDLAVSISGDRVCYAKALTSMEEIRTGRNELAVAATGGNLSGRIRRLVGKDSTDSSRTSWIPSVVTILLIAIIVIPTTLALTAHDKTEHSAQFLLDKMLEHRSRVKNLQYIAAAAGRDETDEFIKWMEDRIKKRREEGASERDIGFSERSLERIKRRRKGHENRYEIRKCTIDNEGRSKIELIRGDYDASGKKMPDDYKLIRAWNGIQSVEFYQKRGSLEATLEATIKDVPSASIHPWRLFISTLCQCLEETIEAKRDVSVEKLKDGTYRIAFDYTTKRRIVAVIDPSKGYTCALREDHNDQGKCTSRYTSTYEEVAEGIWFPVSGQLETFSSDSPNYKRSFKSSQIRINGPAFNASYFDVDMPKGTTVMDEVHGKQYVVGSKRVHDLNEPQKPSAETEEVDPNSWQEKFYSIYSLEDGEVLKRIAPPFIPERRGYFLSIQPGRYSPNTPHHVARLYFNWDGKLSIRGSRVGGGIPRLNSILESVIGLGNREYDIPRDLLSTDMSGDWIVRKGTTQEELLRALEQIIKEETGRDIDFVKQKVETEVIVARGKYRLTPLPNTKEKDCVHVYTDKLDTYSGAGGGSGTLSRFLRHVRNRVRMNIIYETEAEGVELSWRNHYSSDLSRLEHNEQLHNEKVDMLLNNLTRQTGLTFERTTAPVEKWFIAEQESSADNIPVPVPGKSPAKATEDTPFVAVEGEKTNSNKNSWPSKFTADKTRIIHFPKDQAVGTLKLRDISSDDDADRGLLSLPGWVILGQAQGDVSVPGGKDLRLEVAEDVTDFSFLANLKLDDLQALKLSQTGISDEDLVHLKSLSGLLGLDLGSTSIKGPGLVHLAPLTSLRKLSLFNTQVSDAGLEHLSTLKSLKYLNLYITQVRGPGLKHLKSLSSLVRLDLAATPITNESLVHLSETTWLKELELYDTEIGNKGLAHLKPLRSLEELILGYADSKQGYSPITDKGLVYLKELGSLKNLYLLRTRVTDAGLAHLRNLKKLEALLLTETQITGEGLAFLKDLPTLKYLDLNKTGVTTEDLVYLKDLKSLRTLYIPAENLSQTDLEDLGKALPDCTINGRKPIAATHPPIPDSNPAEREQKTDSQVEAKRVFSADKLKWLGLAVAMYADDHDDNLPQNLQELKPYIRDEQEFDWILDNTEYFGRGKSAQRNAALIPIAYDKTLLGETDATNVLFLDFSVRFLETKELEKLDISKPKKEVIKMDPADKAVYKQLETIIVDLSELTPTTSFSDAIEVISNSVDPPLDIVVNWKDLLENADIKPGTEINMDGLPAVLLGTGLESLLKAVAGGVTKLHYIVDNGVIKIGTLKMLPSKMEHRVYDVSDLVVTAADANDLIRRITTTIEPDSWYKLSDKGEGTIIAYPIRQPKKFAVLQTRKIHQKIQRFLEDMHSSRDELPEPNLTLAPEVPIITNTFIDEELTKALKDIASMAGVPIIPDEKVVGLVTAELKDVPLEKALDIVLAGTPYVVKKTPYYYLVASAVELPEIQKRVDSAKKLSNLGKALLIYANDHNDKYPNSLHTFTEYLKLEDFNWAMTNVEYLAREKTIAVRPDTVIAYDKKLLAERKGTNVLFNDSHVEFVKPKRLKELGIGATAILIDTKILSVSEDFLKDIGLDANSVSSSGAWSEHLVAKSAAEPNDETYSLILDDLHISFLLKAVQAHQGSRILSAPQVLCQEGKTASIGILTESYYVLVLGYTEPNDPSDKPEPKKDKVEIGTRIWLKPELTLDSENIKLDFKLEIRQLLGYEERKYKGKFVYLIPRTEVISTKMPRLIPDGKTLLIVGLKIIEQVEHQSDAPRLSDLPLIGVVFSRSTKTRDNKMLLILVKPTINPQQKASKILPGEVDSEDPIQPLGRLLEYRLKHSAEPR